jgi:Ca2+-binding EF-hand superfamily protein
MDMFNPIRIVCLGMLVAGSASAQPHPDTDGDGQVSFEELQAVRPQISEERFSRADTDGDGYLDPEDVRRAMNDGRASSRRLREIDSDGDGLLTLAEIQAVRPEMTNEQFEQLDADGDGTLSRDERPNRARRDGLRGPGGRRGQQAQDEAI